MFSFRRISHPIHDWSVKKGMALSRAQCSASVHAGDELQARTRIVHRCVKRKGARRVFCEAIEPRTYLSVSFAAPNVTSVPGVRSPIVTAHFHGSSSPVDLAVATPTTVQVLNGVG